MDLKIKNRKRSMELEQSAYDQIRTISPLLSKYHFFWRLMINVNNNFPFIESTDNVADPIEQSWIVMCKNIKFKKSDSVDDKYVMDLVKYILIKMYKHVVSKTFTEPEKICNTIIHNASELMPLQNDIAICLLNILKFIHYKKTETPGWSPEFVILETEMLSKQILADFDCHLFSLFIGSRRIIYPKMYLSVLLALSRTIDEKGKDEFDIQRFFGFSTLQQLRDILQHPLTSLLMCCFE
jgi:hypothetical protein